MSWDELFSFFLIFSIFFLLFLNILLVLPNVTFFFIIICLSFICFITTTYQYSHTHINMPRLNESGKWRRCNCTLLLYSIFIMFLLIVLLVFFFVSYCLINEKVYVGSWLIYFFYFFFFSFLIFWGQTHI